jgi:hypothetical protein
MASSIFLSATEHFAGLQRLVLSFPSNLFLPPPLSKNCMPYTKASPVLFLDLTLILIEVPRSPRSLAVRQNLREIGSP